MKNGIDSITKLLMPPCMLIGTTDSGMVCDVWRYSSVVISSTKPIGTPNSSCRTKTTNAAGSA